jgi:hypothetical protein
VTTSARRRLAWPARRRSVQSIHDRYQQYRKVWVSDYGYDEALRAFEKATRELSAGTTSMHAPATAHCISATVF